MSLDIVSGTLATDVAASGTFTVSYPTGRSKGNYDWSNSKHKLFVSGNEYTSPKDFGVTFNANASSITITNRTSGTWSAGSAFRAQFDRPGPDGFDPVIPADSTGVRMISTALYLIDLGSPNAKASNNVCTTQSVTVTTTPLAVLNGALVSGGVAVFDVARNVVAAWTNAAVITVTGKTEFGTTIVEKSASGTSFTGKKAFKSITSVSFSADVTGVTVGTGDVLGLPVAVQKGSQILAEFSNGKQIARAPRVTLHLDIADLSADTSYYVISPIAGDIKKISGVVDGAIGTADAVITAKIATVAVTGGALTLPTAASAAGTNASVSPTAANTVTAGQAIEFAVTGAGAGGSPRCHLVVEIEAADGGFLAGTFVAQDNSAATATTGDVRGTYTPPVACDGSTGYRLLVALPQADDRGVPQYTG